MLINSYHIKRFHSLSLLLSLLSDVASITSDSVVVSAHNVVWSEPKRNRLLTFPFFLRGGQFFESSPPTSVHTCVQSCTQLQGHDTCEKAARLFVACPSFFDITVKVTLLLKEWKFIQWYTIKMGHLFLPEERENKVSHSRLIKNSLSFISVL